ncbi:MAG: aminotransferase class I/II-fold pyridoxal phosphate-dependent enzyme [Chloroflexia bacterium]|nr:aminotransferase class I/II-fold pyridoxal phosphate-dependent enzyme [Chloroflexia bacterium]
MRNHDLDTISVDHLRRAGSVKWSTFPDCLGAWVAEMDFGTAPAVTEALQAAVVDACFGYLPISRREAMAAACAAWYQTACDWEVPAERIHPVPDVIKVMEVAIADYSPPGSKVIVPTPAYMPFLSVPQALGREIVEVPMAVVNGRWELDYAGIEAAFAGGGGLLILCNPLNPLGRVFTRDELCRVSEVVDAYDGRVFADEIHAPIVFPGHRHLPYASISDIAAGHTVTAISASKAWNIPGLKCAQIVLTNDADAAIWDRIGFMAGHGASTLGVIANAAAYRAGGEWLGEVMGYLDGNRGLLAEMVGELLPEVGHVPAEGTYLAWLDFRPLGIEAEDLGAFFREQARVAVVNGRACGEAGLGFVRLNFAMPRPLLEQTVHQMAAAVKAA